MERTGIYGMATPFGVRLCTDYVSAGLNGFHLLLTGVLFTLASTIAITWPSKWVVSVAGPGMPWLSTVISLIGLALYMLLMRLTPLAGIHASEHMVVHALEKGQELTLEKVRAQPRVHPRCGTNILALIFILNSMVALGLALPLPDWTFVPIFVFGLVVAVRTHGRLGALFQEYLTTKEPTDKQLESAIRVGQLLSMNQAVLDWQRGWRTSRPIWPLVYLCHMGIIEVVTGNILALWLLDRFA